MDPSAAFVQYAGNKNLLSPQTCELAMIACLGYTPSSFISFINRCGNSVSLEPFCRYIGSPETGYILLYTFSFQSLDVRGLGFVSKEDLSLILNDVAPHLGPELLPTIFQKFDSDRDGRLTFRDFKTAYDSISSTASD
ncbi:hypothetical protein GEMRC1_001449 [Eukaryota sp. GEM-RC1]